MWADTATPDEGAAQATDLFRSVLGYGPQGVQSALGRVSIIGGHVDCNGGPCVPIVLSHRAYVALSPREDRTVRLISPQAREMIDVPDLGVIGPKGVLGKVASHWIAYPVGVAWILERAGYGPLPGFDAALWSCVSLGGDLSSGAVLKRVTAVALDEAYSLGLAGAIEALNDEGREVLVDATCAAENRTTGTNTDDLDQMASLRCRGEHALALDCRGMSTRQVPFDLSAMGLELLVIGTHAKHSLAGNRYRSRHADCERSMHILGMGQFARVEDLGEATAMLGSEHLATRTRRVVSEIAHICAFIELLGGGPLGNTRLAVAGTLLNDSHGSLHDNCEVSCGELDMTVEAARTADAHGAHMTGGGSDGNTIVLVDTHAVKGVMQAVTAVYAERGWEPLRLIRSLPGALAGRLN